MDRPEDAADNATHTQYESDHALQTRSGPFELSTKHRDKNLALYARVQALLPIMDVFKVSDCDLLYRFLIAKQWDLDAAESCLRAYVVGRVEKSLNCLAMEKLDPLVEANATFLYGFDKDGRPIMWNRPNVPTLLELLKGGRMDEVLRSQMRAMERGRAVSKVRGVDRCRLVVDLKTLQFLSLSGASIHMIKKMAHELQEYYPEILSRIDIFNAGWAVSGIWKILSPFVSSHVRQKVHFTRGEPTMEHLGKFADPENIPPLFGGSDGPNEVAEIIEAECRRSGLLESSR
ncbi:CRAL TRIO domain [Trypanosoma vivax]|nr:hypothetical protein TRVL_04386 [Trypanosoma vivax]KAH8607829.1 CRAL TRIO domain [Trypanosoma vivax]